MEFTAGDARNVRFSGTSYSYDREEVEEFRRRVVESLEAGEQRMAEAAARIARLEIAIADRPGAGADEGSDLDAARKAREQAVALTGRMMTEMLGNTAPSVKEGMAIWQEAITLRGIAEEELLSAQEEGRRLRATVEAEVAALRASTRAALDEEVRIMIEDATRRSAGAEQEVRRLDHRLSQLRTALHDAEARIRGLTSDALTELRMLGDLLALETGALDEIESLHPSDDRVISLEPPRPEAESPAAAAAAALVRRVRKKDETVGQGFYERRLAGLRERLERSYPEGPPP